MNLCFNIDSTLVGFAICSIISIVIIWFLRKQITNHRHTIVKGLVLYPFTLILQIILVVNTYIAIKTNKSLDSINDMISIFLSASIISIMLIVATLFVSYGEDKNTKFWNAHLGKLILFSACLIIPAFLLPDISKKNISWQDIKWATLAFMACSLVISYILADTFSNLKKRYLTINSHFKIPKDWIGFLGTIGSAIISFIATLLTKK